MPRLILFFSGIVVSLSLLAQQPAFSFTQVTGSADPLQKNITTLYQDHRGFIWLGTRKGIARYDGLTCKYYSSIRENGITDWVITCITEDKHGNIWFGTENGLNKLDLLTEKITHYYAGKGKGTIPFNWCNQLYSDTKNRLWLTTEKGLAVYNEENDSFTNYPVQLFGKDDRINKFINEIAEDEEGHLWLSTSIDIKKFDTEKKQFFVFTYDGQPAPPPGSFFPVIFIDHDKKIWASTNTGQVYLFQKKNRDFRLHTSLTPPEARHSIFHINELKIGQVHYLFTVATSGLYYAKNENNPLLLQYAFGQNLGINRVLIDRQQRMWLAATSGLYKLNDYSFTFNWLPVPSLPPAEAIYHIIPRPGINNEYYLTSTQGWWQYDAAGNKILPVAIPYSGRKLLEYINAWQPDENGFWFTSVNGFGYYNTVTNQLVDLSDTVFNYSGQHTTGFIAEPRDGEYWITMRRSGILVYNSKTGKVRHLFADKTNSEHTYGNSISDMQLHGDGYIYFICQNKLYKVNPADDSYTIYTVVLPAKGNATGKTSIQKLFLATADKKLLVHSYLKVYELRNNQLSAYYPQKEFSNQSIEQLLSAGNKNMWVLSGRQVFYTNSDFTQWRSMRQLPGWEDHPEITTVFSGAAGKTIFAAKGAIGVLDNNSLEQKQTVASLFINRVQYGKQESFFPGEQNLIKAEYTDAVLVDVSPMDFNGESKIFYRLEPRDKEWKEMNNGSSVRYEQLPPGNYLFSAKMINGLGDEGKVTSFRLKIIPPFYRTTWFPGMLALLILGAVYLLYRYKLRKAVELEKIRTRIATDLHDDIGATLSSISMYSESLKSQIREQLPYLEPVLNKMGENSRDMVTGMSDIVWAINPDNDSGDKLLQRIRSYSADMCGVKNIQLLFTADETINHLFLSAEQRRNIYLVFKEALNNAVKYSTATRITVELFYRNKSLLLRVKDDGAGFDETLIKKGNGLNNMHYRAQEINARMQVSSVPGQGTAIELTLRV